MTFSMKSQKIKSGTFFVKRSIFVSSILAGVFMAGAGYSGNVPAITVSKKVKVDLKVQPITVAVHDSLPMSPGVVDFWIREGSKALQVKDSPTDVACPVKLERGGSVGTFSDHLPLNFDVIDSEQKYVALRSFFPSIRVKVVEQIFWCGRDGGQGPFAGCADTPGNHIVMIFNPTDPLTLVHEYGHNKGLGLPPVPDPKRIMFDGAISGREVTEAECAAFKQ